MTSARVTAGEVGSLLDGGLASLDDELDRAFQAGCPSPGRIAQLNGLRSQYVFDKMRLVRAGIAEDDGSPAQATLTAQLAQACDALRTLQASAARVEGWEEHSPAGNAGGARLVVRRLRRDDVRSIEIVLADHNHGLVVMACEGSERRIVDRIDELVERLDRIPLRGGAAQRFQDVILDCELIFVTSDLAGELDLTLLDIVEDARVIDVKPVSHGCSFAS